MTLCRKLKSEVKNVFEATLKNISQSELGVVNVGFPISEDQHEETIHELERIEIGAVLDADCCVTDLSSTDCPALCRLIGRMVNFVCQSLF